MTSNQFHDVATLCIAALAGKLSMALAQVSAGHEQDWLDRIIGPTGALVCMGIAIWYLANRTKQQEVKASEKEAKAETKEAERIERDDHHIQQREAMIVQLTEAVTATKTAVEETRKVVEKNTAVMEKNTDALKNHKCI